MIMAHIFCEKNLEVILGKLQIYTLKLFKFFSNNYMKINSNNNHLILSSNDENKKIELYGEVINNTQVQNFFGAHIDYKLKLHALTQVIKYMSTNQA